MANESILIVEDNQMNVQLVRVLLAEEGYDLRSAFNAEEALRVLDTFKPGLILMDIQLPGQNGLELTRQLRNDPELSLTTIVALTGYAQEGVEQNCLDAGCDGYIVKPIDTATFPQIVRSYVDKKKRAAPDERGDMRDLLREMRNNFLVEARSELVELLSPSRAAGKDRLVHVLHRWAGIAGTLGIAGVTDLARKTERSVESSETVDVPAVRAALHELDKLLSLAAATPVLDAALPDDILGALSGKRIALTGFAEGESRRIAKALDRSQSFTLVLEAPAIGLSDSLVQRFDLIIMNLCSPAGALCHQHTPQNIDKPMLFITSRSELTDEVRLMEHPDRDFLMAPWDPEELLVRCCKVLTKDPTGAAPVDRAGPPQIVIADDDPTIAALLTATLRRTGAECHIARTGTLALALTRQIMPDALILDINMPGLDGFEVLRNLRADDLTQRIPVVLLTARQQEADVLKGFAFGASDYIPKPFNPMELSARVARYLPRKKA